jgi:hypothetical protein
MRKLHLTYRGSRGWGAPLRLLLTAAAVACALGVFTQEAEAYDLSRAYGSEADEIERGFVVGSVGLWVPGFGSFHDYHQVSLEFGGEFGIRFASIQGDHNLYVVGGLTYSPQLLDPTYVDDYDHRGTQLILGYAGVRYLPGTLCYGDGLGCLFFELRLGFLYESADDRSGHYGPDGVFTVLPGIGYRWRFGSSLQIGVRADLSYTEEDYSRDLGWLSLTSFLGFGW